VPDLRVSSTTTSRRVAVVMSDSDEDFVMSDSDEDFVRGTRATRAPAAGGGAGQSSAGAGSRDLTLDRRASREQLRGAPEVTWSVLRFARERRGRSSSAISISNTPQQKHLPPSSLHV